MTYTTKTTLTAQPDQLQLGQPVTFVVNVISTGKRTATTAMANGMASTRSMT